MEYKKLEEEYTRIFNKKVLPFIKKKIKKDFFSEPVYHLLEGLKINRFRSAFPIIIAKEYSVDENIVLPLSAFFELTFTTAMAQDDYYDEDEIREGLIASHKLFSDIKTLLACDYINHKIMRLLYDGLSKIPESKRSRIISVINNGMEKWYLSVLMELKSKKSLFDVNDDYIREIYLNKTIHGRMMLECIFIIVQDDEKIINLIKEYGDHLAIAGQLKNDIYDFIKHKKFRGLSDLRQGHITWPMYILIKSLDEKGKKNFLVDLQKKNYDKLIKLFKDKEIIEKTLDLINFHVNKAKKLIKDKFEYPVNTILETWAEGNRNFSIEPKL